MPITLPLKEEPALEGVRRWGKLLRRGRRNDRRAVEALQAALNAMGETLRLDGDYGGKTKAAVVRFQAWAEMVPDGLFGARTLYALSDAVERGLTYADAPPTSESPAEPAAPSGLRPGELVAGLYPSDRFPGKVALTFDDGPNPRTTPRILDALAAVGAKACFFVLGNKLRHAPDVLRRTIDEGHTLGHHSWDHAKLDRLTPSQLDDQLARSQDALNTALGREYTMTLVRPPYGQPFFSTAKQHRPKVAAAFARAGLRNVMWHVDTLDWKFRGKPASIIKHTDKQLKRRQGVVLMHDIHLQTVAALPKVLAKVQARGLAFTTVEALLDEKYGASLTS